MHGLSRACFRGKAGRGGGAGSPLGCQPARLMNYRHAFHVGNFADVLKHSVLLAVIRAMQRKDAPMLMLGMQPAEPCRPCPS
jgi:hypothetical protein